MYNISPTKEECVVYFDKIYNYGDINASKEYHCGPDPILFLRIADFPHMKYNKLLKSQNLIRELF
jgi:hypothetical protein